MRDSDGIKRFTDMLNVSRETIDRLRTHESLLRKWNPAINLVSQGTLDDIWSRHFLDSAQLWLLRPQKTKLWLDIGTGAGFPGLVIAILAAEQAPDLAIGLVESDARKASFLIKASQDMGLTPKIHIERAENLAPQHADVISARAVAPLTKLIQISAPHLAENGVCLFSKGENHELELTQARKYWTFKARKTPSVTNSDGVILRIGGFGRV